MHNDDHYTQYKKDSQLIDTVHNNYLYNDNSESLQFVFPISMHKLYETNTVKLIVQKSCGMHLINTI